MAATARAVDLTDVKEGGNFRPKRKPEGDYKARIVKADDHQPSDASKAMGWVVTIQIDGDSRSTYPYYLSPEKRQAWKIGTICRAAGMKVPAGRIKFDPNKLVGKAIGVALVDEEYNGREKSVIDDMFPASEVQANADEDGIDEDETIEDEVDIPEDDEPEEEDEPEPEPVKPPARRRKATPPPPPVEDDDEDEEDEEEPPPPPRRTARKKAAPKPPPPADDDDDLDDIDLDELD